jgi:hypothetical protein
MREVLACIPDETAVPLSEVGHSADVSGGNMAEAGQSTDCRLGRVNNVQVVGVYIQGCCGAS